MRLRVPSELKEEDILEFKRLYEKNYGEEITYEEARDYAMSLLRLMAIVFRGSSKNL
jgi:hypothetical protein